MCSVLNILALPSGMSLLTYLLLFIVAAYLFQVNPVICVVLVGVVVFFKVRGFFGGRHSHARAHESAASEAALVAMCIALLERSDRADYQSRNRSDNPPSPDEDPLEGLFLD